MKHDVWYLKMGIWKHKLLFSYLKAYSFLLYFRRYLLHWKGSKRKWCRFGSLLGWNFPKCDGLSGIFNVCAAIDIGRSVWSSASTKSLNFTKFQLHEVFAELGETNPETFTSSCQFASATKSHPTSIWLWFRHREFNAFLVNVHFVELFVSLDSFCFSRSNLFTLMNDIKLIGNWSQPILISSMTRFLSNDNYFLLYWSFRSLNLQIFFRRKRCTYFCF